MSTVLTDVMIRKIKEKLRGAMYRLEESTNCFSWVLPRVRHAETINQLGLYPKWFDWRLATLEHCIKIEALFPNDCLYCIGRDSQWMFYILSHLRSTTTRAGPQPRMLYISKRSIKSRFWADYLASVGISDGQLEGIRRIVCLDIGYQGTIVNAMRGCLSPANRGKVEALFILSASKAFASSRVFFFNLAQGSMANLEEPLTLAALQEYELNLPKRECRVVDYEIAGQTVKAVRCGENKQPLDGKIDVKLHERYYRNLMSWLQTPPVKRIIKERIEFWNGLSRQRANDPEFRDTGLISDVFERAAFADVCELKNLNLVP